MQVQTIYDHVILSTCYAGDFNGKHGRVKISHRFNEAGRIEFVELKYLRAFHPPLDGELRKLVIIKGYQSLRKDWQQAEAFVLRVLPQELILLYTDIFRCERADLLAWLVNIGHGLVDDLLQDLKTRRITRPVVLNAGDGWRNGGPNGSAHAIAGQGNNGGLETVENPQLFYSLSKRQNGEAEHSGQGLVCRAAVSGNGAVAELSPVQVGSPGSQQLPLEALLHDRVAVPILEKVAVLESAVELLGDTDILIRYVRRKL
jgi:hypothetical protein